ncbi:MAG: hypothetical protein ACLPKB_20745 [Xanthobacteraceae bacterium]
MRRSEFQSLLRTNFQSFVRKAHAELNSGEKLGDEPYIDHICDGLVECGPRSGGRLVINLPPGHAKTFIITICFAAWTLAHHPSAKIIIVTCGEHLAKDIAYKVREILRQPWFKEIFDTRVAKDRSSVLDFATTDGGALFATSFGSKITGRRADLIIVDDPLDIGDASNIEEIERVNNLFDTVLVSRLNNPKRGSIIIVAHRLHENDLSAHVLADEDSDWKSVMLPLIATNATEHGNWHRKAGELLRPNAFSLRDVERLRRNTVNPDFETLYQQDPSGGFKNRIKAADFATFSAREVPDAPVVLSIDPGQSGGSKNSCSVIQAWCVKGEEFFLLEQWREQARFKEFRSAYLRFITHFRPSAVLVEATGQGPSLLDSIKRKPWMRLEEIVPDGRSKVARLREHIPLICARRIRLPEAAPWRIDYVEELVGFPSGWFDDQVDATTQYLDWIATNPPLKKPPARGNWRGTLSSRQEFGGTEAGRFVGPRIIVGRGW